MRAILLNGAARSKCASEAMWETTFPRNSHGGLGRPFYGRNILTRIGSRFETVYDLWRCVGKCPLSTTCSCRVRERCSCRVKERRTSRVKERGSCHVKERDNIMLPKRRFWTVEQTVWRVFSKHFSKSSSTNHVLLP